MPRPGARNAALWALLAGSAFAMGCDRVVDPEPCTVPDIIRSNVKANPSNVLSAIVTANVLRADSVALRYGRAPGAIDSITPAAVTHDDSVLVPVLGLHPSSAYSMQPVA